MNTTFSNLRAITFGVILLYNLSAFAVKVINSGSDFAQTISDWDKLTSEQQLDRWTEFESKYPYVFDTVIYRKQDLGWEFRQEKKRKIFFQELPLIRDRMQDLFLVASSIAASQELQFKTLFPDLLDNIPIYFLPSMLSFNGKVTYLPDHSRSGLLIGLDFVVKRSDNLDVLFSHEFFHAYHADNLPPGSSDKTMAGPLWKEGFATYVSGLLNPTQSEAVLLMDPELAKECVKPEYVRNLAQQYLPILKSDVQLAYEDWFKLSGPTQPTRRGYCLGLQVIRQIAKTNELNLMATWSETKFSEEIEFTLNSLAK